MKTRTGFVSNSSSCSFWITNISDVERSLVQFVKENPELIKDYNEKYRYGEHITQLQLLISAHENDTLWKPNETREVMFGDEDGTLIGRVFDYMLRSGGTSDNFSWRFKKYNR